MNILIVDRRKQRADALACVMGARFKTIEVVTDVCGQFSSDLTNPFYTSWKPELISRVSIVADGRDLILLHVGESQKGAQVALLNCYKDKRVICFTGERTIPGECKQDCKQNGAHAYFFEPIPGDGWRSGQISLIKSACELIKAGDWPSAKNLVMGHEPGFKP